MANGYIVPHTHWDREWRYPLHESTLRLIEMLDELVEVLSTQKEYKSFLFDGQIIGIDDYLEARPQNREIIETFIKEGRLLIGPWYTLPDLFPISGESIVRNLLIGYDKALKYGKRLEVAYESFGWGKPSQLPQIYNSFGLDVAIISKKVDSSRAPNCEFLWIGKDGTELLSTRLGIEARANFFMHTYMEVMNGKPYKDDGFEYDYSSGDLVFHQANADSFEQDYFKLTNSQKIHDDNIKKLTLDSWHAIDETLLKDDRVMMNGSDSTTVQPQLLELLEKVNLSLANEGITMHMSSIEEYAQILKDKLNISQLQKVYGELKDGPPQALTGNALMTRAYLKQLNKKAQFALFDIAEPLSVACAMIGIDYDSYFLDKALKYLLLSHSHDSINGVTQDKTADDVMYRLNQVIELANIVKVECIKNLVKNLDFEKYSKEDILLIAVNPLPFERSEVLEAVIDLPKNLDIWDFELVDSSGVAANTVRISRDEIAIPVTSIYSRPEPYYADRHKIIFETGVISSGGFKVFKVQKKSILPRKTEAWAMPRKTLGNEIAVSSNILENDFLRVQVLTNGTVNILDKTTNNFYENLNSFESTGDIGDYWIYYPPYSNKTFCSKNLIAQIYLEENTSLQASICANMQFEIPAFAYRPKNYVQGLSKRSEDTVTEKIAVKYTLKKGENFLRVRTEIDNVAKDHKMSVWFGTKVSDIVYSHGHFCIEGRPALPLKDENNMYFNEMTTNPMQSFVSVGEKNKGLAIITDTIGEYDSGRKEELGLTLFRAVKNIICTEFRSFSVYNAQQGGQCLRKLTYNYAIMPHCNKEDAVKEALIVSQKINIDLSAVQFSKTERLKGTLNPEESFYSVKEAIVSAFKKSQDGKGFVLRVFNPYEKTITASATFKKSPTKVFETDLAEQEICEFDLSNFELLPYKIKTFKISF